MPGYFYPRKKGVPHLQTTPIAYVSREQIKTGTVSYKDAVYAALKSNAVTLMQPRLDRLIREFSGTLWLDDSHQNHMECLNYDLGYVHGRNCNEYYAAMYLLTANQDIYRRTGNCYCYKKIIFSYAILAEITPHNYTLFHAARRICEDTKKISILDLMEPETVDDEAFKLIINAFLILTYGLCALKLNKGGIYTNE